MQAAAGSPENLFRPDLFCKIENCPGFWPAGIERNVGYNRGNLVFGDTVFLCVFKLIFERAVGDSLRHERDNGNNAARL